VLDALNHDHRSQNKSGALQRLKIAMLGVVDIAHRLGRSLDWLRGADASRQSFYGQIVLSRENPQ
jgi:hypothetical protein